MSDRISHTLPCDALLSLHNVATGGAFFYLPASTRSLSGALFSCRHSTASAFLCHFEISSLILLSLGRPLFAESLPTVNFSLARAGTKIPGHVTCAFRRTDTSSQLVVVILAGDIRTGL